MTLYQTLDLDGLWLEGYMFEGSCYSVLSNRYLKSSALKTCSTKLYETCSNFYTQPQIKQDYPLNLSILISGGKETN